MNPQFKKCAIYTRKSSEEGLEQEFNSLDAQHASCLAYISSQKSDGWVHVQKSYSDGGCSGGNMNRSGLQELIRDIESGKIDIVVVYKIDRLTRSLADFAKMLEIFDKYEVTFVSVTQSFNTTTSMGRLTLNVLLSFAQFEREITGERIRDKVAASKMKGLWMGGCIPVGYRSIDKKLIVDHDAAVIIKEIFQRYVELGCVSKLKSHLINSQITRPSWVSNKGITHQSYPFSLGFLYKILRNPIYIGMIRHKQDLFQGQHEALVDPLTWERVQNLLKANSTRQRGQLPQPILELLKGKIFDLDGCPYSPSYTTTGGKRYRYYVSQNILHYRDLPRGIMGRVSAIDLENTVLESMSNCVSVDSFCKIFSMDRDDRSIIYLSKVMSKADFTDILMSCIEKVVIIPGVLRIVVRVDYLSCWLEKNHFVNMPAPSCSQFDYEVPFYSAKAKRDIEILFPGSNNLKRKNPFDRSDEEMKRLLQGIVWRDAHFQGVSLSSIASKYQISRVRILKMINETFEIA